MMGRLEGTIYIEITSADPAAAIRSILELGICLHDTVNPDDLRIRCAVNRCDFAKLQSLCQSRGDTLTVIDKKGVFWLVRGLIKRPVLIFGLCFLIIFAGWISTRVFFVQVNGNVTLPDRKIIEAAEGAGIYFGASRRALRSEQVKNTLLEAMPELKWACVNTYGCVAKISVRERSETEEKQGGRTLGSIVADRDGVITSCTATKGSLLCTVGQAVTKGETLISGYTDCGIYIQATQAEGEVYAQTLRELDTVIPSTRIQKSEVTGQKKNYSLIMGKKRINLWKNSGISDTLCDRMYAEYYVTLPGGFTLPVALAVETLVCRETASAALPQDAAERLLVAFSEAYLRSQMVAGSIQASETNITVQNDRFCLTGTYVCTEMIGRQKLEQIGEYNGESD